MCGLREGRRRLKKLRSSGSECRGIQRCEQPPETSRESKNWKKNIIRCLMGPKPRLNPDLTHTSRMMTQICPFPDPTGRTRRSNQWSPVPTCDILENRFLSPSKYKTEICGMKLSLDLNEIYHESPSVSITCSIEASRTSFSFLR